MKLLRKACLKCSLNKVMWMTRNDGSESIFIGAARNLRRHWPWLSIGSIRRNTIISNCIYSFSKTSFLYYLAM
jgi:hypothetical protein